MRVLMMILKQSCSIPDQFTLSVISTSFRLPFDLRELMRGRGY